MMSNSEPGFKLSRDIEHYLAALSKLYRHEAKELKLAIIVNSQVRVLEESTYDNWNGGIYGHALYLSVPEELYLRSIGRIKGLQVEICSDLNTLHNVRDEHFAEVFLELERSDERDWRRESGVLASLARSVTPAASLRVWGDSGYKVFLSHKNEVKTQTAELSGRLQLFGISAFVAHENIHPTAEWQDEIENALASMDAFVALLTENFHESNWTDQEVGFALGRGVPLICVKLGRDPYGFIGKFQALRSSWEEAPLEIACILAKDNRMVEAYITALSSCRSFADGITLSKILPKIQKLSIEQADRMALAFNTNQDLYGSWGMNGARPGLYGDGLAKHLSRATGESYEMTPNGQISKRDH